jgi:peptide-methionine (S)-S-oxide reductase
MRRAILVAVFSSAAVFLSAGPAASRLPDPAVDLQASAATGPQTAILAGGCFWGVEAVFESLAGVTDVVSGYAGGSKENAHYERVGTGRTGHAESVSITYDPSAISYGKLLKVFFAVAHDPTELNRQGPDEGPQYRSTIFYASPDQKRVAEAYIRQLDEARVFRRRIATTLEPLDGFYAAEREHQNFLVRNRTHPYIVYNDLPKLDALKREFPELLKKK